MKNKDLEKVNKLSHRLDLLKSVKLRMQDPQCEVSMEYDGIRFVVDKVDMLAALKNKAAKYIAELGAMGVDANG
jgi:hypothetical protein